MKKKSLLNEHFLKCFMYVLFFMVFVVAINNHSFWIDEFQTIRIINVDTFGQLIDNIISAGGAVSGMPLYFVLEWLWVSIFDELSSEYIVRASNLIFGAVYLVAIFFITKSKKCEINPIFQILFVFNPVILYYMNEARPYIAILAFGAWVIYFSFFSDLNVRRNQMFCLIFFTLGFLSHMMFVFIIFIYAMKVFSERKEMGFNLKVRIVTLLPFVFIWGIILAYYLKIMLTAPEIGGTTMGAKPLESIAQIIYSFLGFGGLALSRDDLRNLAFSNMTVNMMLISAILGLAYFVLIIQSIKNKTIIKKVSVKYILGFGVVFGSFLIANIVFKTRFWERHIIYLIPLLVLLISTLASENIKINKVASSVPAILITLCMIVSSVNTVFVEYYRGEDYKGVSNYIKENKLEESHTILLQGLSEGFDYYGINSEDYKKMAENPSKKVYSINNIDEKELDKLTKEPGDIVIIASSREEFDKGNIYELIEEQSNKNYNNFAIFIK